MKTIGADGEIGLTSPDAHVGIAGLLAVLGELGIDCGLTSAVRTDPREEND